jgi:hypothetical protein
MDTLPPLNFTGGAAGPSNAVSPFTGENMFDQGSIGQIVNFGSGSIEAKGETGKTGASAAVSQLKEYMPYALLFVGGLVAWRMTRKA